MFKYPLFARFRGFQGSGSPGCHVVSWNPGYQRKKNKTEISFIREESIKISEYVRVVIQNQALGNRVRHRRHGASIVI